MPFSVIVTKKLSVIETVLTEFPVSLEQYRFTR